MMKKIMMMLIAAVLLVGCNSTGKKTDDAAANPEAIAAEWVEVTLNVEGMTCDGCENAIKAGVESLDGIAEVESSHEEGWTKVKYDKAVTSAEDIEGKITDTGYTVKGEL
ncbi:MAG: heavy-metal-associated domain-containing protein [Bacteroidales bacterium]|nr:heavy-metal-associated domain-containing protein [Bacteroidales bacterium]